MMCVFLFFLYLNNIKINFLPYFSVLPFFIIGVVIFFLNYNSVKKEYVHILTIILTIIFAYLIGCLVNQSFFIDYVKQIPVFFLFYFFSSFFLFFLCTKLLKKIDSFFLIILFSIVFQITISLIGFINPLAYNFIFSIIDIGLQTDQLQEFNESRVVGVGASFFGAGVLNSFFIVFMTILFQQGYLKNKFIFIFIFIFISIFGLLLSRTTIVGVFLSILIILINILRKKNSIFIFIGFLFGFVFLTVLPMILSLNERISNIAEFGFQFIYDFKNSQAYSSTSEIPGMLKNMPENILTWIIGDAQYMNNSGGYYKDVDVGYLRLIYANGLIGLMLFIYLHFYLIANTKIFFGYRRYIFILFLLLNIKGVANLFPFLILLFIYDKEVVQK